VAISADGDRWCVMNASPDLRAQLVATPALAPRGGARGTPVAAVFLTDAEIDHVAGLLSLREHQPLRLHCSATVFEWVFGSNPIFGALVGPARFTWERVDDGATAPVRDVSGAEIGLRYEAFFVPGKIPGFVSATALREGSTTGVRIVDAASGRSLVYVPVIKDLSDAVMDVLKTCDCVLLDGTFWSDDEMAQRGAGTRTAADMGHLPISGATGSLARLRGLDGVRKIYTHVNNTNPVLDPSSPERRVVEDAGWEVAEDGWELSV
jgi:pyrroloquinoline quinone biosynthesis protein B